MSKKKTSKAASKKADPSEVQVLDEKTFVSAPRKRRESKTDALARKLLTLDKGKMVALSVPAGSNASQYRSYAYSAMAKSLEHLKGKAVPVTIKVSADGKFLAISLR